MTLSDSFRVILWRTGLIMKQHLLEMATIRSGGLGSRQ